MKKKVIILAMSCNQQFFQDEERAIRERGYARYVLEDKFPDVEFWTYTASKDDKFYINRRVHKLYVPTGDGLYDTFEKTKAAFRLLIQSGIEFDYIFRTNMSTNINPKLLQLFVDGISDDLRETIYSSCICCSKDSTGPVEYSLYGVGNSLLLPRKWVEIIASVDFQEIQSKNKVKLDEEQTMYRVDDNAIGLVCNTIAIERGIESWSIWRQFAKLPALTPEVLESSKYSYYIAVPFRDYSKGSDRQIEFRIAEAMAQNMLVPKASVTAEEVYRYQTASDLITVIDFTDGVSATCLRRRAREFAESGLTLYEFFEKPKKEMSPH